MRSTAIVASVLAAALALAACRHTEAPRTGGDPAGVATPGTLTPDDNLNAVLWVQHAAEYGAATTTLYRAAADHLDAALADRNWDAIVPGERDNAGKTAALPPAVILDVDETVLDNSPYQARLVRDGREYDEASWDRWVEEKKAEPVPGVVEFASAAAAKGVTLIYLSNRGQHLQAATLANLRAVGLPVADDSVFLGLGTVVEGCVQTGSEKACRRRLAGRQYRVLMQFGDQLGDFAEAAANTRASRAALLDEHRGWFGERWWMLPNPTYGAWEAALLDHARNAPREARRRLKREALETVD